MFSRKFFSDYLPAVLLSLAFSLELLQYFNFLNGSTFGFSVHLGRIYQVCVIPVLFFGLLCLPYLYVSKNTVTAITPYFLFLGFVGVGVVFSSLLGYEGFSSDDFALKVRPFVEYFIYIYQFLVFCLMPALILRKAKSFFIFIIGIQYVIRFSIFFGIIDFLYYISFGGDLIARAIYDGVDVGSRFHGFFGEPRDAAVIISFAILVDMVVEYCKGNGFYISKYRLFFYFTLILLTKSMSAIIGMAFSLIILAVFFPKYVYVKKFFQFLLIVGCFVFFGFLLFSFDRMAVYSDGIGDILDSVLYNDFSHIPPVFFGQMPNLYPAAVVVERIREFNFINAILGSGLGSVAYINSISGFWKGELTNPHSNIFRLLIDFGLFGTWLYIVVHLRVFKSSIKALFLSNVEADRMMFISVLIIGMSLSHRSATIIMSLGILLNVISLSRKGLTDLRLI